MKTFSVSFSGPVSLTEPLSHCVGGAASSDSLHSLLLQDVENKLLSVKRVVTQKRHQGLEQPLERWVKVRGAAPWQCALRLRWSVLVALKRRETVVLFSSSSSSVETHLPTGLDKLPWSSALSELRSEAQRTSFLVPALNNKEKHFTFISVDFLCISSELEWFCLCFSLKYFCVL